MSSVRIPPVLRETVGGSRTLSASGATVAEVLDDLFGRYPALGDRVSEDGVLSQYVNVYVNDRDVRSRVEKLFRLSGSMTSDTPPRASCSRPASIRRSSRSA